MPMIAEPPEVTRVQIAYVNDPKPGKKQGSIKTTTDDYFGVWPKDLRQFQVGGVYDVEYTEGSNGFRFVKKVHPVGAAQSQTVRGNFTEVDMKPPMQAGSHIGTRNPAPTKQEYWQPKPTNPTDARRIFACGLINSWAHNGRIDMTLEAVTNAVRIALEAYDQTLAE